MQFAALRRTTRAFNSNATRQLLAASSSNSQQLLFAPRRNFFFGKRAFSSAQPNDEKPEEEEKPKKVELPNFTKEELEAIRKDMEANGEPSRVICEIKPEILAKVNKYRRMLFFVNIPLVIFIPFALESGMILDSVHAQNTDNLYMLLQMADFFFFANSLLIYNTLKRMVSSVVYVPGWARKDQANEATSEAENAKEELQHSGSKGMGRGDPLAGVKDDGDRLIIKQYSSRFLQEVEITLRPKELVKCKAKTINPFVGYKSMIDPKQRFATESISIWHNRQLIDSLVTQEDELLTPRQRKTVEKNSSKSQEERDKEFDNLWKN